MALRNIVTKEDKILYKVCRPVVKFNERLHQLLDDMADTLADAGGVGLAAPQVGVLRRAVLVLETNVEEDDEEFVIELINPEIIETSGEQVGQRAASVFRVNMALCAGPTMSRSRHRIVSANGLSTRVTV